jgi:hypothetical protein
MDDVLSNQMRADDRVIPVNVPRQYSYDPRWQMVLFVAGSGCAWIAVQKLLCRCWPHGFSLLLGVVLVTFGLLLTIRRLAFKRFLILDVDAILLPTGFAGMRSTRIRYKNIERVWRVYAGHTLVLCLATKQGKFQLAAPMLPEPGSFVDVENFLHSQAQHNIADTSAASNQTPQA